MYRVWVVYYYLPNKCTNTEGEAAKNTTKHLRWYLWHMEKYVLWIRGWYYNFYFINEGTICKRRIRYFPKVEFVANPLFLSSGFPLLISSNHSKNGSQRHYGVRSIMDISIRNARVDDINDIVSIWTEFMHFLINCNSDYRQTMDGEIAFCQFIHKIIDEPKSLVTVC